MSHPRPSWATFMTDADWGDFADHVLRYFEKRGDAVELVGGVVFMEGDRDRPRNLGNIAAACASRDRSEWDASIARHFKELDDAVRDGGELVKGTTPFEEVRDRLLLRVYDETSTPFTDQLYMRHDLEGTDTFIVVDFPTSVTHLSRSMSAAWGKTDAELFQIAEENLRRHPIKDPAVMRASADEPVYVFQGDFFTSSHILVRETLDRYVGPFGAYVGIPIRESLVISPIERGIPDTFTQLGVFVGSTHANGPGSISPFLYWYYQGTFERCGSGPNDMRELTPFVPERLSRLMRHQT